MTKFGKLKEVDIRELWKHEQYDFSNWLAKEENIEYLNEILGLTLVDIDKEVILSILVDTFISKISLPMQPVPEISSISGA